jgi:hypothetical protein
VIGLSLFIDHLVGFGHGDSTGAKNRIVEDILVLNNVTAIQQIVNEWIISRGDIRGRNSSLDYYGQFPACSAKGRRMEAKPATLRVPLETGLRPAIGVDDSRFDQSQQLFQRFNRGPDSKTVMQRSKSSYKGPVRVRREPAEFDREADSVPEIPDDVTGSFHGAGHVAPEGLGNVPAKIIQEKGLKSVLVMKGAGRHGTDELRPLERRHILRRATRPGNRARTVDGLVGVGHLLHQ